MADHAALDWVDLQRQVAQQLPLLKARLATASNAREKLALSFRIAVYEDALGQAAIKRG